MPRPRPKAVHIGIESGFDGISIIIDRQAVMVKWVSLRTPLQWVPGSNPVLIAVSVIVEGTLSWDHTPSR